MFKRYCFLKPLELLGYALFFSKQLNVVVFKFNVGLDSLCHS